MTWKSYAAVSGATVLAGWLASASPPSNAPATARVASSAEPRRRVAAATDIEEQAAHLQSRLQVARAYSEPQRNPFRFAERRSAAPNLGERSQIAEASTSPIDVAPPGPRVSIAGIAEEQQDGRIERTAILSSPMGVLLVREGETILDYYRVGQIEADAVELVRLSDGTSMRLTLGAPQ
jgi:hypothetical protein